MSASLHQARGGLSFGPFNLQVGERRLTKDGAAVELGARALDLLVALISSPQELISKTELLARVWPDVIVEEGSLRFHMNGLRKALGDGKDGARYIATLPGRGYCFVAPVSHKHGSDTGAGAAILHFPHANLPNRTSQIVGREDDVRKVSTQLAATRFVSIVGAGGVGKTTVATAVGRHLEESFARAVLFVDLGLLNDPALVATGLASMLGLSAGTGDALPGLIAYLRDKRVLLILDTCEHLIEGAAALAASLVEAAPQIHILATSREPLRTAGEYVYRLGTLAYPPVQADITARTARAYPAVQLFMTCVAAGGAKTELEDADALAVADICRRLDGLALAIELAARRVETFGLRQIAQFLDQRLEIEWSGFRSVPSRHRSLQAALDWSFDLLAHEERLVLRRLAVFVGPFTLDAALHVVIGESVDRAQAINAIENLVVKSMVATQPVGAVMYYRLLDTTRAYALDTSGDELEQLGAAARHAHYYRQLLAKTADEWATLTSGTQRAPYLAALNNVRAALEWCFSDDGNAAQGVTLAAAAGPAFMAMSLLPECYRWSALALGNIDDTNRGSSEEMHLLGVFAVASMHLHGKSDAAIEALDRGVAIARAHRDGITEIGLLGMQRTFYFRIGDFKTALLYAKECKAAVLDEPDPAALGQACSVMGRSLHLTGDLKGARTELEASLRHWSRARRASIYLAHELHYPTDVTLARNLWLQGHPTQAAERALQVIDDASRIGRPAALTVILGWAASVFLWRGDLAEAETRIEALAYLAESHSLAPFIAAGQCRKGELAVLEGESIGGVADLHEGLMALRKIGYETLTTELSISLVQGLIASGQLDEAAKLIAESMRRVRMNGDLLYMPELLRMRGQLLLSKPRRSEEDAQVSLEQSLKWSRRQGARGWELRSATDLADLWNAQGRSADARALLEPVLEQFAEGEQTFDLKRAALLMEELS